MLALLFLLSLPAFATKTTGSTSSEGIQPKYVPDVVVFVFSGVLPTDSVSCTYNKPGTTKEEAQSDIQTLTAKTGQNFSGLQISSKALPPSKDVQTSSEFQATGFVDYTRGGFVMEPLISTFKRFKNIEIIYIANGKFTFRGLKDYENKYVSIRMVEPYQYRVTIKDAGFDSLNLPVVVPQASRESRSAGGSGASKWPIALVIALVAGGAVYFAAKRSGNKS